MWRRNSVRGDGCSVSRICCRFGSMSRAHHGPLHVPRYEPAVPARRPRAPAAPGTFAHALDHLLDHEVDLAHVDARFRNDATGAPAYPPAMLRKVVLFVYAREIVRRRAIERVCREHATFMACAA